MTGYLRELKRELKQLKKRPGLGKSCSISDPQQVLPLAKFALKAHAFCNLEARDDTSLDLLARLSGSLHVRRYLSGPGRGEKRIGRARRVPIEIGQVAFRGSLWPAVI
jgi:hypothetical protein